MFPADFEFPTLEQFESYLQVTNDGFVPCHGRLCPIAKCLTYRTGREFSFFINYAESNDTLYDNVPGWASTYARQFDDSYNGDSPVGVTEAKNILERVKQDGIVSSAI